MASQNRNLLILQPKIVPISLNFMEAAVFKKRIQNNSNKYLNKSINAHMEYANFESIITMSRLAR